MWYPAALALGALTTAVFSYATIVVVNGDLYGRLILSFHPIEAFSVFILPLALVFILVLAVSFIQEHRPEIVAYLSLLSVTIACLAVAFYQEYYHKGELPLIFLAWLGTIGWIITNLVTTRTARIQHTLDTLVELRTNDRLHFHRQNIFSRLGYNMQPSRAEIISLITARDECKDWEKEYPIIESITFMANLYDNIAYGVRYYILDRKVVELNIRNLIVNFYVDYIQFIRYHNEQDSRRLEHLVWLADKFGAELENEDETPRLSGESCSC
jgi:hypothetical protein